MVKKQPDKRTLQYLAANLRHLMDARGYSQLEVSKRAKISQKSVSNMLNEVGSPRVDIVEKVAGVFGLELWQLLLPSLVADLQNGTSIQAIYEAFCSSTAEGKVHILRVAEREAEFNTSLH